MKSSLYAVAAMFLYAVQNVIIERKLTHLSPITFLVFFYIGTGTMIITAVIFRQPLGLHLTMPAPHLWWIIALCGVLLFFADYCFFSAYHSGGSLMAVTTIVILLPVFASFIKWGLGGGMPGTRQFLAWASPRSRCSSSSNNTE